MFEKICPRPSSSNIKQRPEKDHRIVGLARTRHSGQNDGLRVASIFLDSYCLLGHSFKAWICTDSLKGVQSPWVAHIVERIHGEKNLSKLCLIKKNIFCYWAVLAGNQFYDPFGLRDGC